MPEAASVHYYEQTDGKTVGLFEDHVMHNRSHTILNVKQPLHNEENFGNAYIKMGIDVYSEKSLA